MDHKIIYLVHILFVAPLLMYSGYIGRQLAIDNKNNKMVFEFLAVVGLVVLLYHAYKLYAILSL